MKCNHENICINEIGTATTCHFRNSDGTWWHESDFGDYTGMIDVSCSCGFSKRYNRKRLPKWLLKYIAEIGI